MDVVMTRAVVLLLILWWPLGITATVWKDTTWRLPRKIAVSTGAIVVFGLLAYAGLLGSLGAE